MQSTFLKIWKERERWPPFRARGGSFRLWLYDIAHHELVDNHRREVRNAATPRSEDPADMLDSIMGPCPTPEQYIIDRETRNHLRACLGQLNPLEAHVLRSKIFDEETLEKVGTSIWPDAARSTAITNANRTMHKGLVQLKRSLMAKGIKSVVELAAVVETDGIEEKWSNDRAQPLRRRR